MTTLEEPLPVQDQDAERTVLGAMMLSPQAVVEVPRLITAEDFYVPKHQWIFEAILSVERDHGVHGMVAVSKELTRRGEDKLIGGITYLHTLVEYVQTATNATYYADLVAEAATRRRLDEAGTRLKQLAHSEGTPVEQIVDSARGALEGAAVGTRRGVELAWAGDIANEVMDELRSPVVSSIPMGWADLDAVTGGMRGGELIAIGARPGHGKTVMAVNIATHVAKRGLGAVVYSLEMSRREVLRRVMADLAGVDQGRMARKELDARDWFELERAQARLNDGFPLFVSDNSAISMSEIYASALDMQRTTELGVVTVDYMQLMNGDPRVSREQQVSGFSRDLKLLAKRMDVPVVMVSQLNRSSEMRPDKKPRSADLRESGGIEQNADKILLLHHDAEDEIRGATEIDVIVDKNRQGRTGTVSLRWSPWFARVAGLAPEPD